MKILSLALALMLGCANSLFSAPRDRIDPKTLKDKVSITLGTEGTIQFKQNGNTLAEPKLIKSTDEKEPGVGYKFESHSSGASEAMLLLIVRNHYPKVLRYRAAMRIKGRKDYVETSIVPVGAGLACYESWVDPIEELILFDFKLTDEKMQ